MKGITEINYVVKFILNFTDHLSLEQPIPFCGENEFYYKYTIHLKKVKQLFVYVNYILYLCIDNVREMSGWGNNTSWSVDSNLPLYIIKDPQSFKKKTLVCFKCYSYICFI
jgi:hypothetical protein